jgi:SpoVK/Ycf46/Vps4 family AAA+-type ATPase
MNLKSKAVSSSTFVKSSSTFFKSSSAIDFLAIISHIPTLIKSKSRSLVATTHKSSKRFLTTTIRERFYIALSFTFVTFVLGLSISIRSRYKDQSVTRFIRNTLPALGTIYETMGWDTFENIENHLISGLQLKQSETGEEVPVYLKRLDLYDDAVVFQMREPWDKLKNQQYVGFYPLDFHKLQSRQLLFQQTEENLSSPVSMLQIASRRWFTYNALRGTVGIEASTQTPTRQIEEKESRNFLQRDLSSIQRMLYKIFLYFDEVPAKLGTWSSPSIDTFSMAGDGQRISSFISFYKKDEGDNHKALSTVKRTDLGSFSNHYRQKGETASPTRKVTFAPTVLDATSSESTVSAILKPFKWCSIEKNQEKVRSLLIASRENSLVTPSMAKDNERKDMVKNEKESIFQQEAMEIDLSLDDDLTPTTNGEGLTQNELEESDTLEFIAQSLPVYTNKVTLLSQKEFIATLFEAMGKEDMDFLGEKSISWFPFTKRKTFSSSTFFKPSSIFFKLSTTPRLMSGYTYPDFMRGDIEEKFVQLLVKNRGNWHQIPSASILVTKEVTLPSSILDFSTQEDRLEETDAMVLPVAKLRYQDIIYTGLDELRNILSSLKIDITDDDLEQVDLWELAYWGPAAVQNKATKDIIPRNRGKINRRVAALLQKSDQRISLLDQKANFFSKKEFHWGERRSRENLRLALQARPQNELLPKENSSFVDETAKVDHLQSFSSHIEDKSTNVPIKGGRLEFKDVFAGLEPKVMLLDPTIIAGDEEEVPIPPTEIIVTKSPSFFNEKDETIAIGSKEWADILKSIIGQALSGKEDLGKIEILLPTIMVADSLDRSSPHLSPLLKSKNDPLLKAKNYHVFTSTEYQELVSATRYFFGETTYMPLSSHGKESLKKHFTESKEVPLLVCHFLPPSQTASMETSTKQTLTSTLYKKQRTSFSSRYPFTNGKGFPFSRKRSITQEATYFHKKRPLFHEIWEPISPNSWMIVYKLCFAMWVQEMGKDFYKQYGKEMVLYALHLLAALGFNAQEIIEDLGLGESPIRIIRKVNRKFADVAGINSILPELGEIVWLLRSSGRGGQAPKGILLVGPPGTGKTFVVQALAGEAKVPVIVQSASALTDPDKKESGSQKLRDLFDQARQLSPCILFIDEIDTLGVARPHVVGNTMGKDELLESIAKGIDKSGEIPPELHYYQQFLAYPKNLKEEPEDKEDQQVLSWERIDNPDNPVLDPSAIEVIEAHNQQNQSKMERLALLMQFLMEIDGLKGLQGVVVIGATNRPSVLDPAFIRPGRFEKTLFLQLPDREKRIEILKLYAKKLDLRRSPPNSSFFRTNGHSSREERPLEITDNHLQNSPIPQQSIINQVTDTPWEYIANRTAGLSAAHLAAAVNQSSIKGIIDETGHTIETIEHGINRVIKRSFRQSAHSPSDIYSSLINHTFHLRSFSNSDLDIETDMESFYLTSFYTFASGRGSFFTKTDATTDETLSREGGEPWGWGPSQDPKEWTSQKEKLHQCASQIVVSLEDKTVSQYMIDNPSISNSLKASIIHGKSIQRFAFYQSGKAIVQMALPLHPPVSFLPLEPEIFNKSTSDLAKLIPPHGPSEPQSRVILETRLIGVYAGKAGELLGGFQCYNSSQQSEKTGLRWPSVLGFLQKPINQSVSKNEQQSIVGITGLSSQSNLGVEELTFAGLIINHMISSWYLYSKKISLRKLNLAYVSQEESEIEVEDPILLDLFRYLDNTIENETRIDRRASFIYQQHFAPSWWQLKLMTEELYVEPKNADWYRLHLPDPKETERNIHWVPPDNHYHSVNAKLFKDIGRTSFSGLTWNDLYLINRDYIYQTLISSCFHKAITLLDKNRELLDLFADQLIRYNLLREYEINIFWKQFHIPFSSAVTVNRQEQADTTKSNPFFTKTEKSRPINPALHAKKITGETSKTKKEERQLGNMRLHKDRRNERQIRWVSSVPLGQLGGPYSRRGKYRFVDFDFINPCFFTKKKKKK